MTDTKRILELALKGLEAERTNIQNEIADLESQIRRFGGQFARKASLLVHSVAREVGKQKAPKSPQRRRLSAAARKKLSDSAKRRWVASKKAGKSTL